jgi:hypothetical protein
MFHHVETWRGLTVGLADTLRAFVDAPSEGCSVNKWLNSQDEEINSLFNEIIIKKGTKNLRALYDALSKQEELPFKLTLFRQHLGGYCSCQQL